MGLHAPVGIPHNALQEDEVHQSEFCDRGLQVKVNNMLPADTFEVLGMTHPGQMIDDLLVAWNFDAIPTKNHVLSGNVGHEDDLQVPILPSAPLDSESQYVTTQ